MSELVTKSNASVSIAFIRAAVLNAAKIRNVKRISSSIKKEETIHI